METEINIQEGDFVAFQKTGKGLNIILSGQWIINNLPPIEKKLKKIHGLSPDIHKVNLDVSGISLIDTAGMILFIQTRLALKKKGIIVKVTRPNDEFLRMFNLIEGFKKGETLPAWQQKHIFLELFEALGRHSHEVYEGITLFFDFVGRTFYAFLQDLLHLSFRVKETTALIQKTGFTALPIIAITTFLIGIVIAFQSAFQLKQYGANIFIVEIVTIAMTRELSPIITSIVIAGRSGSSFTAQLGAMKITEELDAMSVMGFDIFRFLVLPRTIALVITLPLLIFFGDVIGIFGGMTVAKLQLGVTPASFIERLRDVFPMRHFYAGLIKGPFFAVTIATIGCFRGLQVTRDTESIGRQTTISVVNSIFMVIIIDALFSIIFTEIGI